MGATRTRETDREESNLTLNHPNPFLEGVRLRFSGVVRKRSATRSSLDIS